MAPEESAHDSDLRAWGNRSDRAVEIMNVRTRWAPRQRTSRAEFLQRAIAWASISPSWTTAAGQAFDGIVPAWMVGSVGLVSAPGQGSTFWVELALAPAGGGA